MRQLSGADSMFLQFERRYNFMHVASLAIYDPSTAPGGGVRFKDVLRFFASRVAQFPPFRRRLVTLPLSLDRPYWVESASIDVEFHVRHIALPYPGDWRQSIPADTWVWRNLGSAPRPGAANPMGVVSIDGKGPSPCFVSHRS